MKLGKGTNYKNHNLKVLLCTALLPEKSYKYYFNALNCDLYYKGG